MKAARMVADASIGLRQGAQQRVQTTFTLA